MLNFVYAAGNVGSVKYTWWWLICTAFNLLTAGALSFGIVAGALLAWKLIGA